VDLLFPSRPRRPYAQLQTKASGQSFLLSSYILLELGQLLMGLKVGLCLTDQAVKGHGPSLAARPLDDFLLFVVAFPSVADFFPDRKQHLKFTLFVQRVQIIFFFKKKN